MNWLRRRPHPLFALALALGPLAGCTLESQTRFLGNPRVPGGPDGCRARCENWRLEFVGMVAMGDYSDGCICQVPGKAVSPAAAGQAAAAGVFIQQVQEEEEEARRRRRDGMWNRPGMRTR